MNRIVADGTIMHTGAVYLRFAAERKETLVSAAGECDGDAILPAGASGRVGASTLTALVREGARGLSFYRVTNRVPRRQSPQRSVFKPQRRPQESPRY